MEIEYLIPKRLRVKFTTGEGDATRFAKDACEREFDAYFAWVVMVLLMKLLMALLKGGFKSTFGFIPVGTVNDMSRHSDSPKSSTSDQTH